MAITEEQSGDVLRARAHDLRDEARLLDVQAGELDKEVGVQLLDLMESSRAFEGAIYALSSDQFYVDMQSYTAPTTAQEELINRFEDANRLGHELYVNADILIGDTVIRMSYMEDAVTFTVQHKSPCPDSYVEDLDALVEFAKRVGIKITLDKLTEDILSAQNHTRELYDHKAGVEDHIPADMLFHDGEDKDSD